MVVKHLVTSSFVPREVRVCSPLLHDLLSPLARELAFKLVAVIRFPAIDEARASFQMFLGIDPFG